MAEPKLVQHNPPWGRDELILALDFYLRHSEQIPGKQSPEIAELSATLNQIAQALGANRDKTYR